MMINLCMIDTTLSNDYTFSLFFHNGHLSLIYIYRVFTNVHDKTLLKDNDGKPFTWNN